MTDGSASPEKRITTLPGLCRPNLVQKVYADRAAMGRANQRRLGHGRAPGLRASLVASGYPVRLSAGTAPRHLHHRHAVIHDQNREKWDEGTYIPLQNVADGQGPFVVIDSILSKGGAGLSNTATPPPSPTRW